MYAKIEPIQLWTMHYSRGMLSLSAPYPPSHLRELSLFHQLVTEHSYSLPVVSHTHTPPALQGRVVLNSCRPRTHTPVADFLFDSSHSRHLATQELLFILLTSNFRCKFWLGLGFLSFHRDHCGHLLLYYPPPYGFGIIVRLDESLLTEWSGLNTAGCAGVIRIHCVRPQTSLSQLNKPVALC